MATHVLTYLVGGQAGGPNGDLSLTDPEPDTGGTFPADFDPTAVNSVRFQYSLTGTGFSDDTWTALNCGQLRDVSNTPEVGAQVNGADTTGLGNETHNVDETDNSPTQAWTLTEWETNVVQFRSYDGLGNTWAATYQSAKMADGGIISLGAAGVTVTIDYTPTSTDQTLTASLLTLGLTFPQADVIQEQFLTPDLLTLGLTFPTATMGLYLEPSLLTLGLTFPTAQINRDIQPSTLSLGLTFPTATVLQEQLLNPDLLTLGLSFPTAAVIQEQFLTPALLTLGLTFPTASIARQEGQDIAWALPAVLPFPPQAAAPEQTLEPSLLTLGLTFYTAQVDRDIQPSLLTLGLEFFTSDFELQYLETIAVVSAMTAALTRAVTLGEMAVTSTMTPALQVDATFLKQLDVTSTMTAALDTTEVTSQSIDVSGTWTPALSVTVMYYRALDVTSPMTAALVRQIQKDLDVVTTMTAELLRHHERQLDVTSTMTPVLGFGSEKQMDVTSTMTVELDVQVNAYVPPVVEGGWSKDFSDGTYPLRGGNEPTP